MIDVDLLELLEPIMHSCMCRNVKLLRSLLSLAMLILSGEAASSIMVHALMRLGSRGAARLSIRPFMRALRRRERMSCFESVTATISDA